MPANAVAVTPAWRGWIGLGSRLVLGGVLLVAGLLKVGSLGQSVLAVQAYRILPYELTIIVGYALPLAEIFVGLLLITGLFTRLAGLIGGLFMLAFIIGISSAWARGLSLDCGCFGGGGEISPAAAAAAYPWEIARDVVLLAMGAWLTIWPTTPWSLDALRRPLEPTALAFDDAEADEVAPGDLQSTDANPSRGDH